MVGGGCRGLELARTLVAEGHAVRVVTRDESRRDEIEGAGCECWIGDPDRIGTLRYAPESVTVLMWLLGTVDAEPLHGSRLRMMLEKITDSTVRGVVYELGCDAGVEEMRHANRTNEIPFRVLDADPRGDRVSWLTAARECIDELLAGPRREQLV
jgi:hypothetical protein